MDSRELNYLNVFVGENGICEYHGGSKIFVPREDIRRIELTHGAASERPRVQLIIGIVLLAVSAYMFFRVITWLIYGAEYTVAGESFLLPAFPAFLGGWMVWTALRKRTYLSVTTGNSSRKIIFRGPVESVALQDFLERAGREHGYVVISALPGIGGS